MTSTSGTHNFYDLPFDQYSRQEIVRKIVEECIRPYLTNKKRMRIIDLGGHKGHTNDFFPNDEVSILDVFEERYSGYIKGDATKTNFMDGEFDLVVSFDTLEHIPQPKREKFILEAARISKHAFIITAPFDNNAKEVSFAEKKANQLYATVHNKEHPWLSEHLAYGIPSTKDTETSIEKSGKGFVDIPTNNLLMWLLTQGLMFNSSLLPTDTKEVVDVSRYYNTHLFEMEHITGQTYRHIYVCSSNPEILKSIKITQLESKKKNFTETTLGYVHSVNSAYATLLQRLLADREYLSEREKHLQEKYDEVSYEKRVVDSENNLLKEKLTTLKNSPLKKIKKSIKNLKTK